MFFTADLHHLQDHFTNFQLNLSSLAKNAKKRDLKAKRRFALQNMQLHEMPSPKYEGQFCCLELPTTLFSFHKIALHTCSYAT